MAKTKQQFNREYYLRHRVEIFEGRRAFRSIHGQRQYLVTPEKRRGYWLRWYGSNRDLYLAKKRLYSRTPKGVENQLERLYRFIDRHPEYDIAFLERMIKAAEQTVSLAAVL